MRISLGFGAGLIAVGVMALAFAAVAQDGRVATLYADTCQRCHGSSMEGLDVAPPLTGPRFLGNYLGQPAAALASRIRTSMPLDMPGSLGQQASADLTAAILAANGYPAGSDALPSSSSQQQTITIDAVK